MEEFTTRLDFKLSKRSLRRLKGVEPMLIAILVDAIRTSPFDFGIPRHGGFRTESEQYLLYKQVPKVTRIDGYKRKSYHQTGRAFDIYAYVDGKASWDKNHLTAIARHIQKVAKERYNVRLDWGGDFKTWKDMPHFEVNKSEL